MTKDGAAFEEAVGKVVEYLYRDEHEHWQEHGWPKDHIFRSVKVLACWLDAKEEDHA
jgi:hypothetical protein